MMHVWTTARGQVASIASGRPLSPSQTTMHTSATPRFLSSVNICNQNFAPSPPSPAHKAQNVAGALNGDRQGHVDRPVGDLPIADLHVHRVPEDHRIDRAADSATLPCPRPPCR